VNAFPDDIFNLADIALKVARQDPGRLAVVEPHGRDPEGRRRYNRYTYAQLSAEAESVAPGLREMGIAEKTRVVFMAPPSYEAAVAGLALSRVGAVSVWIDPAVGYRKVAERLRRIEPEAFLGIALAHVGRLAFGWGRRTLRKLLVVGRPGFPGARSMASLHRPAPANPSPPAVTPEDPTAILYTTGSTGPAKPALFQHRNLCEVFRIAHRSWRFDPDKEIPVDMAVFPAFLFIPISAGGTMVVPPIDFSRQGPAKASSRALVEVINDCGVKSLFASPVLLEKLGCHARDHGLEMPTFKRAIGGGAPVMAQVKRALLQAMGPGGEVVANYGATEALPSTEMDARETLGETWSKTEQGAGICVGRPFPGIELKVISIVDGPIESIAQAQQLKAGQVGEILVRGKHVSPFYFREEESTRKNKVPDDNGGAWHRFGDAGYLDETGRLWCCGRVNQIVKTANGPMFPLMCEPIFDAHPEVRRSGLAGVPGPQGQLPVICVELEPAHRQSAEELRPELLALAASHPSTSGIRHVLFSERLPVDPRHNSKIERLSLAKWAAEQLRNQP
jgi:acyl-CoA synthetase (AMP-forming)/AMP-acid ligase II